MPETTSNRLPQEIETLRARLAVRETELAEARETLRAIREGEVDALVVSTSDGQRIFTLQSADQAYQAIVEQMQEGALTLFGDGHIHYSNHRFAEIVRRPLDDVIGSQFADHLIETDRVRMRRLLDEVRQGPARSELTLQRDDGSLIPIHVSLGQVVRDGQNSVSMVVTDLTERRRVEEVLASERFVRSILDQAADGILVCDAAGRVTFANKAVRELVAGVEPVGLTMVDAIANWGEAFYADGRPVRPGVRSLTMTLRGRVTSDAELRVILPTGRRCDILANASPLRDDDGRIIGAVATFTDITERKRAEDAERQQREWLRVIISSIGDAMIATDTSAIVTLFNPVAAVLTGWSAAEAVGRPIAEIFPVINERTRQNAEDVVARVLAEKQTLTLADGSVLLARDGREVPIEDSASPIFDADGNLLGAVLIFHDVSAKRRSDEETRRYIERLRTTNEQLALFNSAMVDRELRMVELKREVNDLCDRCGAARRYVLAFTE
ncbi:MAG: PAS domain S-box protein [Thermoguttaceae bacterium]